MRIGPAVILLGVLVFSASAQTVEQRVRELALANFDTAVQFEKEKRYDDALKYYERLIESGADEEVILRSRIHAGNLHLSVKRDVRKAKEYFEAVANKINYPEIAAEALLGNGRAILSTARTKKELDEALGEFEGVVRIYPRSNAAQEGLMAAAQVLEFFKGFKQASDYYIRVIYDRPQSEQAAWALYRLGLCWFWMGDTEAALVAFQKARNRYPNHPAAGESLKAATVLYRLYFSQFKPRYSGQLLISEAANLEFKNPSRMLAKETQIWILDGRLNQFRVFSREGKPEGTQPNSWGNFFGDPPGEAYAVSGGQILTPDKTPIRPFVQKDPLKREPFQNLVAFAITPFREMFVADEERDGLFKLDEKTYEAHPFGGISGKATRMEVDGLGNLYVLHGDGQSVTVMDHEGKRLAAFGRESGLERILDFTLDGLGNAYVLDKEGTTFIYSSLMSAGPDAKPKQLDRLPIPQTEKKKFRNPALIAVSQEGVVYVSGEREVATFR